ncbi:MAG: ribosomal RNA small subunit methyltransferase A [Deltaproteobacteria bacterium]|nr:ribosomal RNA small subunit methyltransferase A [Deltaproteobacteria bacterium]
MTATKSSELLRARGLRPKKSFGQSFLQEEGICLRIAELATTPPGGVVLEIGAGLGALTRPLLARASRVVAIERDRDLVPILRAELGQQTGLELVEADAATHEWRSSLEGGPAPRVVAGNLPYAITGRLVARVVEHSRCLDRAVLMVQREVADRLVAEPGGRDYGVASVFAQAAFVVERPLRVAAGAFWPVPKVDSAVVVLTPHPKPRAVETPTFREVVKRAFAQRRKTLRNAWKGLGGRSPADLQQLAEGAGIDLSARGETLAVEAFAQLAQRLDDEAEV